MLSYIKSQKNKDDKVRFSNDNGYYYFYELIKNNISIPNNVNAILKVLANEIKSKANTMVIKMEFMKLLPRFFIPFVKNISITFQYISCILIILENSINIFTQTFLSEIFKQIITLIFKPQQCTLTEQQLTQNYEIFQGYCIHNMNKNNKSKQLFGINCLCILIEHLDYFVLYDKYMKYIWEQLIMFLEQINFIYKKHLLFCLKYLIMKCGGERFKTYANDTLYKLLELFKGNYNGILYEMLLIIELIVCNCKCESKSLCEDLVYYIKQIKKEEDEKTQNVIKNILSSLTDNDIHLQWKEVIGKSNKKKDHKQIRVNSVFKRTKNEMFFKQAKDNQHLVLVSKRNINSDQTTNEKLIQDNIVHTKDEYDDEFQKYEITITDNNANNKEEQFNNINKSIIFLIKQIKTLSHKQLTLIDSLNKMQKDFHKNKALLTNRITKLETLITHKLFPNNIQSPSSIPNENTHQTIQHLNVLSLNDIRHLSNEQFQHIITAILSKPNNSNIHETISFLKKLILIKHNLSQEQLKSIFNHLQYISHNSTQLNDEFQIELELLLHYFK
jgi:hypothetical protein